MRFYKDAYSTLGGKITQKRNETKPTSDSGIDINSIWKFLKNCGKNNSNILTGY